MERYIAFLRGINISGKNKIAMPELKKCFEGLGFCQVVTYLNSGNVVFSSDDNAADIKSRVETMIDKEFGLQIPVHIISCDYLQDILLHAPQWWGTDDASKYHNLIFIMSQDTAEDICNAVGEPSQDLEEICVYKDVIFWTFDRNKYSKCNWWKKTAAPNVAGKLTIRTAKTVRKLVDYA